VKLHVCGACTRGQGQLPPILTFMALNEIRDRGGQLAHLQIAATAQFGGDIFRSIFRPALGGI
jgi:hypothetical protein